MIDLHTHTIFSDGELIPAELVRRAQAKGYSGIAMTDHADSSNLDWIIPRIVRFCEQLRSEAGFRAIPGIELTHVAPHAVAPLAQEARKLGAKLIVVHGETIVEPVAAGTNRAALEADIDILAHPGLLTEEEALLARKRSIALEISARKGHCLTNGHVARIAKKLGALLVLNTDAHSPHDLIDESQGKRIALGAGLSETDWQEMLETSSSLLEKRC